MFDQFKQLGRLQKLQKQLAGETIKVEKDGVSVVINGKMEVESIGLNSDLDLGEQENILRNCINEAVKKAQMAAAQKMLQIK